MYRLFKTVSIVRAAIYRVKKWGQALIFEFSSLLEYKQQEVQNSRPDPIFLDPIFPNLFCLCK